MLYIGAVERAIERFCLLTVGETVASRESTVGASAGLRGACESERNSCCLISGSADTVGNRVAVELTIRYFSYAVVNCYVVVYWI